VPKKRASSRTRATRPPLQRMLRIHAAIQSGAYPNTTTLAREIEVSARSLARDLEFMRDSLGLPLSYDAVRHGFFYEGDVGAFPTLQITEGELFALMVAEKALQQYRGTVFEKRLLSAFEKVSQSLPDTISLNLGEWSDSVSFRTSAEPILNLEIFDRLAQATARREQLRLLYRKPGQQKPEARVVDPYHLANVNGEWFLFAHDHLRNAIRTFAPGRVLRVEATGETFERNLKFSIEAQLQGSFGVRSGVRQVAVVVRFESAVADYVREKKWHPSQRLRDLEDGGVELSLTLSGLEEIERWILSWGGSARVIEPRELADRVRAEASRMLRK